MKHEYVGFPHDRVRIDLQGPLPETAAGNRRICVIQDHFYNRMEWYALKQILRKPAWVRSLGSVSHVSV